MAYIHWLHPIHTNKLQYTYLGVAFNGLRVHLLSKKPISFGLLLRSQYQTSPITLRTEINLQTEKTTKTAIVLEHDLKVRFLDYCVKMD